MRDEASVWLYGSTARGDADSRSDIDILVVSDAYRWRDAAEMAVLGTVDTKAAQVSLLHFGWSEIEAMAEYGSLFLHHVHLEGRPLIGDRGQLAPLLQALPPYMRGPQEVRAFQTVLSDVRQSIGGEHSPSFELSVIATALRHAFILGCYVSGQPDFGRTTPFRRLCRVLGEGPDLPAELASLYDFRLHHHQRAPIPFSPTTMDVRRWLDKSESLFAVIQERVDAFDRRLHQAA